MDHEILDPIKASGSYANELVEMYNENYLGDDYELRNVEKILGRRIRIFADDGIKNFDKKF